MMASVRSESLLRRRLEINCHTVIISRRGGKMKFRKALGRKSTRQLMTKRAVKIVDR